MKKFFTLAALGMMALTANAQFTTKSAGSSVDLTSGYNRIGIAFTPTSVSGSLINELKSDYDATCNQSSFGLTIDYVHGFNLTGGKKPLFLEVGGGIKYAKVNADGDFYDGDDCHYKTTFNSLAIRVPVNITYKIEATPDLSIAPYAGLHLMLNLSGKVKHGWEWIDSTIDQDRDINLFDGDDLDKANMLQVGYQLGCGVNYKAFYAKVGYSAEITPYISTEYCGDDYKATTGGLVIGLGYTF